MAARAEMLGDAGANHPDNWVGGLASPDLHAIVILFARDVAERERCRAEHEKLVAQCEGVELLSSLDLEATPPFDYAHDHFGYRDRLSQPAIEGSGEEPTPGSGAPLKAGEFILGYPDENGPPVQLPQPEILSRNGSFMAYRRLEEHVGAFRDFLKRARPDAGGTGTGRREVHGPLAQRRAACVWRRTKTTRRWAPTRNATTTSTTSNMDPQGYAVPLGSHIRRMNPRDTAANMNRRRMIRRGATYGPPLPEGAPEDGKERGIAAFVICASLIRQFEFAQNVWVNDRNFHELGNERDPIIGNQDGTLEFKIPKRPIRKKITGLAGLHDGARRRVFFPARPQGAAIPCVTRRCSMSRCHALQIENPKRTFNMSTSFNPARTYNQNHVPRKYTRRQTALEHLLDLELPVGGQPGSGRNGQSFFHHDRSPQGGLAQL